MPDHTTFHSNVNPYSEDAHRDWNFDRGGKRGARGAVAEQARAAAQLRLLDTIRILILAVLQQA